MNADPGRPGPAESPLLARREDFRLGTANIRPSIRQIEGSLGNAVAEPRVMQVLLAFIDARGAVLTRDDLIRTCWSGAVVGEDAVNRTVAEIRRIARATGVDFGVETIPRVGYRLTGYEEPALLVAQSEPLPARPALDTPGPAQSPRVSRRWMVGGAVAGLAGAGGLWWLGRTRADPRFESLMETGRQALRLSMPGGDRQAADAFGEAVKIQPGDAAAWGLLALSLRNFSSIAPTSEAAEAVLASEGAARRALQLDSREPNALFTLLVMRERSIDWLTMEQQLRRILDIEPSNEAALDQLAAMLQAAGYVKESWEINERAISYDPLRPVPQYRKALKLWILGRWDEADRQAAQNMTNWPTNSLVRNSQLLVSAFTGRLQAARQLIDDPETGASMLSPQAIRMWHLGLTALETRSAPEITAAREAALSTAPLNPGLSVHAILLMSALNEVDAAYSVIEGFMLRRGLLVTQDRAGTGTEYEADLGWRYTQWLYTPATAALRKDARYERLCEVIGLAEYWRRRGIAPDEQRAGA